MPPKKKQGPKKKGAKEKKKEEEKLKISILLKELRVNYESKCVVEQSLCYTKLRDLMKKNCDDGLHITKWVITEGPPDEQLKVKLSPVIAAIRNVRYIFIKELYVWDIHVKYEDLAALRKFFQQPVYTLSYLELVECKIDNFSLEAFCECLATCSLSALVLDYNIFGDEGCKIICSGLKGNALLTKLSMKYCGLTTISGTYLGKAICDTAVSELYLDGNQLECEGIIELIKMVVDRSEQEAIERRGGSETPQASDTKGILGVKTSMSAMRSSSALSVKSAGSLKSSARSDGSPTAVKKKKRKKSSKKKTPPAPPKVGPWLTKLHIFDNGIDAHGIASKYAPVICMRLVKKWIATAEDLKELDIDDNLIGDLGGREIADGLQLRKDAGLPNATVWVTHRIHPDTFNKIITLGSGGTRKGKKKKKGKPGKKRV